MHGSTPDHAKWSGVNSFVRSYCELATQYIAQTGDRSVSLCNISKLKNPFDTVWPAQKSLFDTVYADTLMLLSVMAEDQATPATPLYNLFVSGSGEDWTGKPFQIELSRCAREYTAANLTSRYGGLDRESIVELKRAPCIFAYEAGNELSPKFGYIREIVKRQGQVRVEYELHRVQPFLTAYDLEQMTFELDIGKLELYRTHWSVKEVNLPKELHARGITLPSSVRDVSNAVDISRHTFDIARLFRGRGGPL